MTTGCGELGTGSQHGIPVAPSSPEGFSSAPLPLLMGLSFGSEEGNGLKKSFQLTLPAGWSYSGATKYGPRASSENRAPAAGLPPRDTWELTRIQRTPKPSRCQGGPSTQGHPHTAQNRVYNGSPIFQPETRYPARNKTSLNWKVSYTILFGDKRQDIPQPRDFTYRWGC